MVLFLKNLVLQKMFEIKKSGKKKNYASAQFFRPRNSLAVQERKSHLASRRSKNIKMQNAHHEL